MPATQGIGRERGRFSLECVRQEVQPGAGPWEPVYDTRDGAYRPIHPTPPAPPPAPERARLRIRTPLRIKHDGRFVGPRDFRLPDLLRHLYSRLQRLALLYGGQPETLDCAQAAPLAAPLAAGLRLDAADLVWHDWTRYSSRQDTLMQLGGLMGELTLCRPRAPSRLASAVGRAVDPCGQGHGIRVGGISVGGGLTDGQGVGPGAAGWRRPNTALR